MKILVVNEHPKDAIGGSQIQTDLIATHLARLGHEVVYIAVQGNQQNYATNYKIEPHSLGFVQFKQILSEHRPDIVYWRFNRRKFLPSMLACKLMRVKVVSAITSLTDLIKWAHRINFKTRSLTEGIKILCSFSFIRHILSKRVNYFGYYLIDGIIVQLEQQTRKLPVRKEIVIYNSVDDSITPFHWDRPFIVWVGNLRAVKNPEIYVDLARNLPHIDFLMVGKIQGPYKALLKKSSLYPNFHYLGPKPNNEVNGILQQSLFLVLTSGIEGFPNVFIQAWMQAKPTVSLYYDPDNMIRDNNIGCVSGSFEQLVRDTKTLIEDETLREEMGQRARAFAEAHFNPDNNARKFEAFFREICENSPRRHEVTKKREA